MYENTIKSSTEFKKFKELQISLCHSKHSNNNKLELGDCCQGTLQIFLQGIGTKETP